MTVWLLTVWLTYGDVDKVWLEQKYSTEKECRRWLEFYNEYPFKPICKKIKEMQ